MSFRERRVTSQDNLSLYLRDYGDPLSSATPVLCLGGLTRNSKDFRELAERLAGQRRVICPDYRGRGRSAYDPIWRNYTPTAYLTDVFHILSALNLHRVIVVGTSLGGLLAMGLGATMPSSLFICWRCSGWDSRSPASRNRLTISSSAGATSRLVPHSGGG